MRRNVLDRSWGEIWGQMGKNSLKGEEGKGRRDWGDKGDGKEFLEVWGDKD